MTISVGGLLLLFGTLQALGWALAHTLWQGGLIVLVLHALLGFLPSCRCRLRYRAALAAGGLLVALFVATATTLMGDWSVHARCWHASPEWVRNHGTVCRSHGRSPADVGGASAGEELPLGGRLATAARTLSTPFDDAVSSDVLRGARRATPLAGLLALLWLAALPLLAGRTLADLKALARIRRTSEPTRDAEMVAAFDSVRRRLGLPPGVELRSSDIVGTPGAVGVRTPMVLVPPELARILSPDELRCLFAHELAHAVGRDYSVGLIQLAVQRLLFFNPFLHRISRIISAEREALRDQMAAGTVGSSRRYGAMLLTLERCRTLADHPVGLVSVVGEGALLRRVRRLAEGGAGSTTRRHAFLPWLILTVLLLSLIEATSVVGGVSVWATMSVERSSAASAQRASSPPRGERTRIPGTIQP